MKHKVCFLVLGITIFSGCATTSSRVALKSGYDLSKIKTIGLGNFTSYGGYGNSAEIVVGEFTRQLIQKGYLVKQSKEDIDIVLEGTISQFAPSRKFLFYSAEPPTSATQTIAVITPQAIEIGGSNVYSLGYAFGLRDRAQILISNATIGITVRLVDLQTQEIIWTNSFTYEGLDIQSATEGAVRYLVKSLAKGK